MKSNSTILVPVLFCQKKSIYKTLELNGRKIKCDVYDEDRNALNFDGTDRGAAIYHPPCRLWSRMRYFSTADEYEKYFGLWAVRNVRKFGGVLEHPASSSLFTVAQLPLPGSQDEYGFTIELDQFHFGHKARKRTWLYIVGLKKSDEVLKFRTIPGSPKYVVASSKKNKNKKELSNFDADGTPKKFAKYLVKIVCKINNLKNVKNHENKNQIND